MPSVDYAHPLTRIRLQRGLSAAQLADLSGVSVRTVSGLEARQERHRNVKLRTIISLARALDLPPVVLFSELADDEAQLIEIESDS